MANKQLGRYYLVFPEETNGTLRRGHYYYAGRCKHCTRNCFLDEYEAYEFVNRAKHQVERRSFAEKILSKIPRLKVSFVSKEEQAKREYVG